MIYKPCHLFSAGNNRNPQTESFLQFLELPYLLDNALKSRETAEKLSSIDHRGSYPEPRVLKSNLYQWCYIIHMQSPLKTTEITMPNCLPFMYMILLWRFNYGDD